MTPVKKEPIRGYRSYVFPLVFICGSPPLTGRRLNADKFPTPVPPVDASIQKATLHIYNVLPQKCLITKIEEQMQNWDSLFESATSWEFYEDQMQSLQIYESTNIDERLWRWESADLNMKQTPRDGWGYNMRVINLVAPPPDTPHHWLIEHMPEYDHQLL